jgi:hypothetical protein
VKVPVVKVAVLLVPVILPVMVNELTVVPVYVVDEPVLSVQVEVSEELVGVVVLVPVEVVLV